MKILKNLGALSAAALVMVVGLGCAASDDPATMPSGAKEITLIGNGWSTFKLSIDGKERTFLYRRAGIGSSITETITELR